MAVTVLKEKRKKKEDEEEDGGVDKAGDLRKCFCRFLFFLLLIIARNYWQFFSVAGLQSSQIGFSARSFDGCLAFVWFASMRLNNSCRYIYSKRHQHQVR